MRLEQCSIIALAPDSVTHCITDRPCHSTSPTPPSACTAAPYKTQVASLPTNRSPLAYAQISTQSPDRTTVADATILTGPPMCRRHRDTATSLKGSAAHTIILSVRDARPPDIAAAPPTCRKCPSGCQAVTRRASTASVRHKNAAIGGASHSPKARAAMLVAPDHGGAPGWQGDAAGSVSAARPSSPLPSYRLPRPRPEPPFRSRGRRPAPPALMQAPPAQTAVKLPPCQWRGGRRRARRCRVAAAVVVQQGH